LASTVMWYFRVFGYVVNAIDTREASERSAIAS
jgi:hypothetical protein